LRVVNCLAMLNDLLLEGGWLFFILSDDEGSSFTAAAIVWVEDRWAGGRDYFEAVWTSPLLNGLVVVVFPIKCRMVRRHVEEGAVS
jgi:hypothetical protein